MSKKDFLTIRWNNLLSLGLGLPTLIFVFAAFITPVWSTKGGMIALSIIGVMY